MTFAALGLSQTLLRALDDAQYSRPTAIQQQSIPPLLGGADLLGIAQTGTGKTAAFTLPLLQILAEEGFSPKPRSARALILAPTRELALQIADSIRTYGRHGRVRLAVIMGGVSARAQIDALRRGVDILIATPGRLLDLVQQRHVVLGECEFLVIDEADRMLDMGFIRDVRKIVAMLPDERQTLLFSATMPAEIARLAGEILHEPERVEITARTVAVERVEQYVHHLSAAGKRDRLTELLRSGDFSRVIVFTRTKRGADQVVKRLAAAGIDAEALHGNKSQNVRQRTLSNFRGGKTRILVATDIASRGIDVDGVTHVINYELPHEPESYVHRIGRTARAGASGIAISFCDPGERTQLRAIERLVRQALRVVGDSGAPSSDAPDRAVDNTSPRARSGRSRRNSRRFERRAA
jgi:ATP-dependent RNA helicase RhlE